MNPENANGIERHPWEPFIPEGARVLIMGTFPPGPHRWSMDFYYPNRTNDFWKVMGLLFYGSADALLSKDGRYFDLPLIKRTMEAHHIALHDTCRAVRRLKGNASDKFLEVVEPVDLAALTARMPELRAIATTGEKAAEIIAGLTGVPAPKMGEMNLSPTGIEIWRMPSTSRAYPLALNKKAEYYRRLFPELK